jgi:predicted dehydrogenase
VAVASDDPVALTGDLSAIQGNLGTPGEKFDFSSYRKYADWKDAIKDPDAEAVDLCLPTYLHESAAIAALEAGKHVLVEKPMALDGAAADRILAAGEKANHVLMVAQVLRFFAEYQPLVELQRSGRLGTLRSAMFRRRCAAPAWGKWLQDPAKGGGGVFDLLIHDVDMCLHLFGKPQAVSAVGHEEMPKGLDVIHARVHYAAGADVIITGGWHHPQSYPFSMEYTVSGDGGTVEYSSAGRPPVFYRADGEAETLTLPEKDGFQAEIEYFLDCASNGRQPERCHPRDSAAAVKLTRLMTESRARKGETIECKL